MDIKELTALNIKSKIGQEKKFEIKWILFSSRILKNHFFRLKLREIQMDICPVCEKKLYNKPHLHHKDYNHICQLGETIEIPNGRTTKNGKQRIYKAPNCEKCYLTNLDFFNSCVNKTVFVHHSCHMKLHKDRC